MSSCNVLVRGNQGIFILDGKSLGTSLQAYAVDKANAWRSSTLSPDGKYYAIANGTRVFVYDSSTFQLLYELERCRVSNLQFSPRSTYLVVGETYGSYNGKPPEPNVHIYEANSGKHITSYMEKRTVAWKPLWTSDEKLCARFINNEIHFYENNDFCEPKARFHHHKIHEFSLCLSGPPYYLATYTQGAKGQPSFVKVYRYPQFDGVSVVASKSFFKADRILFQWNPKGSELTFIVSTDVDKSGSSYYGEQFLYFVNNRWDASNLDLSKSGPIHNIAWNPNGKEMCVVYGFTPAKATLFNMKGDAMFDFGTGTRNVAYYNPFGNMLLLGGFGNLSGDMEVWDVGARKQVASFKARDTTQVCWDPAGEFLLTATLSPRLRICNGIRLWHHSGSLQYENVAPEGVELWEVEWFGKPEETLKPPVIVKKPIAGIVNKQPAASQQAYRPPGARNRPATVQSLHEAEIEPASFVKKTNQVEKLSKNAVRNKKKQEKKCLSKDNARENVSSAPSFAGPKLDDEDNLIYADVDPDKAKQIRKIMTKLKQINIVKEQQKMGKKLELNQLTKLEKEQELLEELEALKL